MKNLEIEETEFEREEEDLGFKSTNGKPEHYLGYFDTPEKMAAVNTIIHGAANKFYGSNSFLFESNSYSEEDLVNEIHLKLLHKFKEQENPFWVENFGNLKTICYYTLSKLIRNLRQESNPMTTSSSCFIKTGSQDFDDNDDMEDILFKGTKDLDADRDYLMYLRDFIYYLEIEKNYDEKFKIYSKLFRYNLYLTESVNIKFTEQELINVSDLYEHEEEIIARYGKQVSELSKQEYRELSIKFSYLENLTEKELETLDNIKNVNKRTMGQLVKLLKPKTKSDECQKIIEDYMEEMERAVRFFQGTKKEDTDIINKFFEDKEDQDLILNGCSLEGRTQKEINRLLRKGGIIDINNPNRLISQKDEANRLTKIEKDLKTGITYKVLNGRIVKKEKALSNREKRALAQERWSSAIPFSYTEAEQKMM